MMAHVTAKHVAETVIVTNKYGAFGWGHYSDV